MIVIEPVGVQRSRYPGSVQLPVIVPPSPKLEMPAPERKSSALWAFGLLAGLVYLSSEAGGSRLGETHRKQRGNRLYYMYVPPGKWFEDAIAITKKKLPEYQHRANTTPGNLYYIFAESADTARYLLRTDKNARDDASYQAILAIKPEKKRSDYWFWISWGRTKAEQVTEAQLQAEQDFYYTAEAKKKGRLYQVPGLDPVSAKKLLSKELQKAREYKKRWGGKRNPYEPAYYGWSRDQGYRIVRDTNGQPEPQPRAAPEPPEVPPEQLTLFSGRIANCAIWIPSETGDGWVCGGYGRVCDPPTCATPPDPKVRQSKVCVQDQSIFSAFYDRMITRCKKYEPTCEGPACMPSSMPYPTAKPEKTEPGAREVKSMAQWMADEYNEETFEKQPILARQIMERGGIRSYRKGREKEEYKAIPLFMKDKTGLPADEMAAEMGFDTDRDLFEAIAKAYPPRAKGAWKKLRRKNWEDFQNAAFEMIEEGIEEGTWSDLSALILGQELFPGLKRELVLEPPEDVATSDDPVTACMERLGWKIPRMIELRESIAEKRTPDLFTGKTKRLNASEKEYQRVMSECLTARSGTAGLVYLSGKGCRDSQGRFVPVKQCKGAVGRDRQTGRYISIKDKEPKEKAPEHMTRDEAEAARDIPELIQFSTSESFKARVITKNVKFDFIDKMNTIGIEWLWDNAIKTQKRTSDGYMVYEIEPSKILEYLSEREERKESYKSETEGKIAYSECWECGKVRIVGWFKNGKVERIPYKLFGKVLATFDISDSIKVRTVDPEDCGCG